MSVNTGAFLEANLWELCKYLFNFHDAKTQQRVQYFDILALNVLSIPN